MFSPPTHPLANAWAISKSGKWAVAWSNVDAFDLVDPMIPHIAVKEAVLPFARFPGVDTLLGPEMRSTGEVMGVATATSLAFGKSTAAAGMSLPIGGRVFISVRDDDKAAACHIARRLRNIGFEIVATDGTAGALAQARIPATRINKVMQGSPHVVDWVTQGRIQLVINTTAGAKAIRDSRSMRRQTVLSDVPYFTTIAAAVAAVDAIAARRERSPSVCSIQEYHERTGQLPTLKPP